MDAYNNISIYYAPFDHLNLNAKVVILGITPGATQANMAIRTAKEAFGANLSDEKTLKLVKSNANFSGPTRKNLISILNFVGLNQTLGIKTCSSLWTDNLGIVQFTSALRYPVFVYGKNYSGTNPKLHSSNFLMEHLVRYTGEDLQQLSDSLILPLGKAAAGACKLMIEKNMISENQVAFGLPHPSGANIERISYFLKTKSDNEVSNKTNTRLLKRDRDMAMRTISQWSFK